MIYTFKVKNDEQYKSLMSVAKLKKLSICDVYEEFGWGGYPYFCFEPDAEDEKIYGSGGVDGRIVGFGSMMEKLIAYVPKKEPIKIKLNSSYTAEIDTDKKVVVVGCQKIPFAKVKEIAKHCK